MKVPIRSLPLIEPPNLGGNSFASSPTLAWNGFTAVENLGNPLNSAAAPPEPDGPQGEYRPPGLGAETSLDGGEDQVAYPQVELLAPAGSPNAGFAAFHYGADAIYLGLKKFSARAEAENFTMEEVAEVTAYAHSLHPRRRVFVTLNTLIRQDELHELVEFLGDIADIGVDAIIIQDLGVYQIVRRHFPELELHASTQLAVHNRAGAEALKAMGFTRVVLARELTLEEVRDITATSGIETEVFIHGALCYSYSGLCLFSSQTLGRSGNRGKCAYSCRDSFQVTGAPETLRDGSPVKRNPGQGFPFSMKDLALPEFLPLLRKAGVSCFKIEGRKKSPLYVATTTDYYRKLLDGLLPTNERTIQEADLQTVFSRPWTRLFIQSHKDKEVADRDTVGHRGALIGRVFGIRVAGLTRPRIIFRTQRTLERHDGLQVDLPGVGKPFGFPVNHLWIQKEDYNEKFKEVFEVPSGSLVQIELPADYPSIPEGAPIYCSSSQAVKRHYRHERPRPGVFDTRKPILVDVLLTEAELVVTGQFESTCVGIPTIEVKRKLKGPFPLARNLSEMERAAQSAFEKLGETRLFLDKFTFRNPEGRFVPVSMFNQIRRELTNDLEIALRKGVSLRVNHIQEEVGPRQLVGHSAELIRWSIKVDRTAFVDDFQGEDWSNVDELVVDIARDHPSLLLEKLDHLGALLGRDHIRLALPALTRKWEEGALLHKVNRLKGAGWTKWEAANLSAWFYLGLDPSKPVGEGLDLACDWPIYILNRLAARKLLEMGVTRFTLSPEDGVANIRSLFREFGPQATIIVYQDTPLFMAESCAYANLIGGCPGKANCQFETMEMVSSHGERVTTLDYHCRSIVLNQEPYCLTTRLGELADAGATLVRADFIYRHYSAPAVRKLWQMLRRSETIPGCQAANFDRGVL